MRFDMAAIAVIALAAGGWVVTRHGLNLGLVSAGSRTTKHGADS